MWKRRVARKKKKKKERKKELDIVAVTDGVPCRLGDNDPRDPRLTPYPVNVIEGLKLIYVYELHEYTM